MDRIGGEHKVAGGGAPAKDELADVALLACAIGEDAREGAPAGLAHALAGKRPDHVVGADRDHVLQPQAMQGGGEVVTLAIQTVGEHDREVKALRGQLLDELDRQLRLAPVDISPLEAATRLEYAVCEGAG